MCVHPTLVTPLLWRGDGGEVFYALTISILQQHPSYIATLFCRLILLVPYSQHNIKNTLPIILNPFIFGEIVIAFFIKLRFYFEELK